MYYEKEEGGSSLTFVTGLAIGAIIGASVALLAAPQGGKHARRQIVRAVADARDVVGSELEGAARQMKRAVRRGRRRIRR